MENDKSYEWSCSHLTTQNNLLYKVKFFNIKLYRCVNQDLKLKLPYSLDLGPAGFQPLRNVKKFMVENLA